MTENTNGFADKLWVWAKICNPKQMILKFGVILSSSTSRSLPLPFLNNSDLKQLLLIFCHYCYDAECDSSKGGGSRVQCYFLGPKHVLNMSVKRHSWAYA